MILSYLFVLACWQMAVFIRSRLRAKSDPHFFSSDRSFSSSEKGCLFMVKIVADTTSCLPVDLAKKLGIYYIPQEIVIGEETYRDDTQMNATEFLRRQRTSPVLPKTSAPGPIYYEPVYRELVENGDSAVILAPSTLVSGTFRGATVAARDFPELDIRVVDTRIIAGGLGSLVLEANRWAQAGMCADEIVQKAEEMCTRHRVYFLVDTLQYLYKGGRIGAASHLLGSLLQMKPILTVKDGLVAAFETQRTFKRACSRLKEIITAECPQGSAGLLSIMHGDALETAQQLAQDLSQSLNISVEQIPIYDLTPAILVHSGPGTIAIAYYVA
jgi:DegV family protein with EDD domain